MPTAWFSKIIFDFEVTWLLILLLILLLIVGMNLNFCWYLRKFSSLKLLWFLHFIWRLLFIKQALGRSCFKKETLAQVFSCEFCEFSKNTFLHRSSLVAASVFVSTLTLFATNTLLVLYFPQCVKNVLIRRFFWYVFSRFRTEYGEIRSISPYSVRMRENTDQKKFCFLTLFMQCLL